MPPKKRPGVTGVYVELPDELLAKFEQFVDGMPVGTKAQHIRLAIQRHMASPPETKVVPLPPVTMVGPAKPKKKKPKGK